LVAGKVSRARRKRPRSGRSFAKVLRWLGFAWQKELLYRDVLISKVKNPAGFNRRGIGERSGLTFAILKPFPRAGLAILFAILHARITRQETFGLQGGSKMSVSLQQCSRDAVAHSPRLP